MDSLKLSNLGYENKYKNEYDSLLEKSGGIFKNKKDILILSAVIGFNSYSVEDIEEYRVDKKNFFPLQVEFNDFYDIIYSLAICYDDDVSVVINPQRVEEIINKCSGKGFKRTCEILKQKGDTELRNFEDFIQDPKEYIKNEYDYKVALERKIEQFNI